MKGIAYYESSAELKSFSAFYILGFIYEGNKFVKQNIIKAIYFYEKSAELNKSAALYKLSTIFLDGYIADSNIPKAIDYLEKCISIQNGPTFIAQNENLVLMMVSNKNRYNAYNDLGFIYLIAYQDIGKS